MIFVICSIILKVKNYGNLETNIWKRISERSGAVGFNASVVVFPKILIFPALVILSITLGVKRYADYENIVTEWISLR